MVYTQKLLSYVCGLQPYGYIRGALTLRRQKCYLTSFLPRSKPSAPFYTVLSRSSPSAHNLPSFYYTINCLHPGDPLRLLSIGLHPAYTHFLSGTYFSVPLPGGAAVTALPNTGPHQLFNFEIKHRNGTVVYRVQLRWS